ncbi:MAG: C1 family peptidase [Muribaculaceae bacterium]|nr:C1 family peptidase [Muribaculaceae bacterium]
MNKIFTLLALSAMTLTAGAYETPQRPNGISAETLQRIRSAQPDDVASRAIRNALTNNDIDKLAYSASNRNGFDDHFSHRVASKGITDQKSSGRCWLFTGLNVLRSRMMSEHDLQKLELSQAYNFFYDQLEKSNLFLQGIIDTASAPDDDKMVEWLFRNPLSDGGQYTGFADNVMKYGVVPKNAMVETVSSSSTAKLNRLLKRKLREYGLELRRSAASGTSAEQLSGRKEEMLTTVYSMLSAALGEPPTNFTWVRKDSKGNFVERVNTTPQKFYADMYGDDLRANYVMLMNDPSRPYYRLYEIDFSRHTYDGSNWIYVNLPTEDIKQIAVRSLQDSTMMYFSCDVNKFLDRDRGLLDIDNYDYDSLFGTTFGMDKADRIRTFDSASSHAMTLVAVDLDDAGKPQKWMVENSWGDGANGGHLVMTDRWFDEYMFRLVVDKKHITPRVKEILTQTPQLLPAWDPMFADEQ